MNLESTLKDWNHQKSFDERNHKGIDMWVIFKDLNFPEFQKEIITRGRSAANI